MKNHVMSPDFLFKQFLIPVLAAGMLVSCGEKNKLNEDETTVPVLAGILKDGYIYENPDIQLEDRLSGCKFYSDRDSFDLDLDGNWDFSVYWYHQLPDLTGECCECPDDPEIYCDCSPYGIEASLLNVQDVNLLQFALDSSNFPLALLYGDTIDQRLNWQSGSLLNLARHEYFPDESYSGNWSEDADAFLAYRFLLSTDTIYGWIQLSLNETVEIFDFYLDKALSPSE